MYLYVLEGMYCGLEYFVKFIFQYWIICWLLQEEGQEICYSKLVCFDIDLLEYLKVYFFFEDKEIIFFEWYKVLLFEYGVSLLEVGKERLIESEGDYFVEFFKRVVGKYNFCKVSE